MLLFAVVWECISHVFYLCIMFLWVAGVGLWCFVALVGVCFLCYRLLPFYFLCWERFILALAIVLFEPKGLCSLNTLWGDFLNSEKYLSFRVLFSNWSVSSQ